MWKRLYKSICRFCRDEKLGRKTVSLVLEASNYVQLITQKVKFV